MVSFLLILVAAIGLVAIVACGFWVMSAGVEGGGFRSISQSLKSCPQCGTPLDATRDSCPKCALRVSV